MTPLHLLLAAATALAIVAAPLHAQVPSYVGQRESTPADLQAIERVTVDFRTALKTKDTRLLSSLLLNDQILFVTPLAPAAVRQRRERANVHSLGMAHAGAQDFIRFIENSKVPVEERFYNIQIVQDRHLAWVMFDFDFLEDGKVENHGVEAWQLVKGADDAWKILSVVWSSKGAPR